jgi:hypothetical protein
MTGRDRKRPGGHEWDWKGDPKKECLSYFIPDKNGNQNARVQMLLD